MSGLMPGISNEVYHASPAIGSSRLKQVLKCPALYHANQPFKATAAMEIGTVVHAMVLEPDTIDDVAVIKPSLSGKGARIALAEFKEENKGKICLTCADWQRAEDMAASVLGLPDVGDILSAAQCEHSGWYDDPITGLACRYRPDARTDWLIADVKTCQDASPAGFSRAIENFGYHISAAHYIIGDQVLNNIKHQVFAFLCVESTAPYLAATYLLSTDSLEFGKWKRAKALAKIKECTESGVWPGYNNNRPESISVPYWSAGFREFNEGNI
jgi:hypothetical protein